MHMRLLGQVWPPEPKLTIPRLGFSWQEGNTERVDTISVKITDSVVEIDCDVPDFDLNDNEHLGKIVGHVTLTAQGAASLATFISGNAFYVRLECIVTDDGIVHPFQVNNPSVVGLCTSVGFDQTFSATMVDITPEPLILHAMSDLTAAIAQPHYALVACARAVEAIRHVLAGPDADPGSVGWPAVRSALNADRPYLELITRASIRPRHGERMHRDIDTDENEVIRRAWTLMDRLLHYRKRGNVDLTEPDFPLLRG